MPNISAILPPTTDDPLLDGLSIGELIRFGWISKEAGYKVESYITRNFKISDYLHPFIPAEKVEELRRLMGRTNAVISGSIALQFFARTHWEKSDLDIYVEKSHAFEVASWITSIDYAFKPKHGDFRSLRQLTETSVGPYPNSLLQLEPSTLVGYFGANQVLNFKHKTSERKIQIIMCQGTPLQNILNFHSTAVVNLITHDSAYCIYPKATLEEKKSLYQPFTAVPHQKAALDKYRKRGYDIVRRLPRSNAFGARSLFPYGRRRISDSKSLKIKWEPQLDIPASTMTINSWTLGFDTNMAPHIYGILCHANRLEFSYIISCDVPEKMIQTLWTELLEENPGNGYLDRAFGKMVQNAGM